MRRWDWTNHEPPSETTVRRQSEWIVLCGPGAERHYWTPWEAREIAMAILRELDAINAKHDA